jgi:hypothetical protein
VGEGRIFMRRAIPDVRRRRVTAVALAVTLAAFPAGWLGIVIPAHAVDGLLSCDGSTVYSVQRRAIVGLDGPGDGTLNALTTSTVGGSSVTTTAVTTIPEGGDLNALGITADGTAAYAVNQTAAVPDSAVIHHYDAHAGTWDTFTGSSNVSDRFVAGAVDPVNGIYYYASYAPGSVSTPATATIYGFNTVTNTAISGVIGTVSLGDGDTPLPQNGDMAFDRAGNMYLLSSDAVSTAINVVHGPVPTTGSAGGVTLSSTLLTEFASTAEYVGMAFGNDGGVYVQDFTAVNGNAITKLNPSTGATLAGPTPLSANAQTVMNDDLGSCMVPPALTLQKNVVSRFSGGAQYGHRTRAATGLRHDGGVVAVDGDDQGTGSRDRITQSALLATGA